jgi:hypothetical protein
MPVIDRRLAGPERGSSLHGLSVVAALLEVINVAGSVVSLMPLPPSFLKAACGRHAEAVQRVSGSNPARLCRQPAAPSASRIPWLGRSLAWSTYQEEGTVMKCSWMSAACGLATWAILVSAPVSLAAQAISGSVVGTVRDQTNATLPGATITVRNQQTQEVRSTVSEADGNYSVLLLRPGVYSVIAELSGFNKEIKSDVAIQIDQKAQVDFALKVGDVTQSVEVKAEVPLVETHSSDIGQIVNEQQVVTLPLNGRSFIQLALLTTGSITGAQGGFSNNFAIAGIAPSIQGGRSDQNNFLLDGISINDRQWDTPSYTPSIDAIREFKVQSGLYTAESGFAGAAEINVALKSGTSAFHGSGYEFLRNEHLNAKNYFDSRTAPIPPYNQNQFGGSFGGQVITDRTFFFVNAESLLIRKTITATSTVPTAAMRAGDFSGQPQIFNPFTYNAVTNSRQPFANNVIPTQLFNPAAVALLNIIPLPNLPGSTRNLLSTGERNVHSNQINTRVDHTFGASDLFFAHVTASWITKSEPYNGNFQSAAPLPPAGFPQSNELNGNTISAVWNHTISPRLVNEARFGYTYTTGFQSSGIKRSFAADNGIAGTTTNPNLLGVPSFSILGYSSFGDSTTDLRWLNRDFGVTDNMTFVRNGHAFKWGGIISRIQSDPDFAVQPRGSFSFTSPIFSRDPQNPNATGNTFADFLMGLPTTALSGVGDNQLHGRGWELSAFIQDDWTPTSKLTLNLGLRYELRPPLTDENARLANFNFGIPAMVIATNNGTPNAGAASASKTFPTLPFVTDQQAGLPSALTRTDYKDFAPRLGLAYSLSPRTVMRAGFGMFYDTGHRGYFATKAFNPPFFNFQSASNAANLVQPLTLQNILASRTSALPVITPDPIDFPSSRLNQYSVNIQREVSRDTVVEVYYLGSRGYNLLIMTNPNQPAPGPGPVSPRSPVPFVATSLTAIQPLGHSWYDSLNARVQRRLSNGLSYGAVYTWANSLDQASRQDSTAATPRGPQNEQDLMAEKGRSDVGFRHRVVANAIYMLPFGNQRSALGKLSEGWTVTAIVTLQGNTPLTPTLGADISNTGIFNDRPNVVGDPNSGPKDPNNWFNNSALALPAPFTFGSAGRNVLEGPDFKNLDVSVMKDIRLNATARVQLRLEAFNITNAAHFDLPNAQFDSPSFGKVFTAQDPRVVQLGLKILW